MTKLEALIFDVDGTLIDTEELHRQAFNQAFLLFHLDWVWTPELYAELLGVSGGVDRIARYAERCGLTDADANRMKQIIPSIHREKTRIFSDILSSNAVRLRPGVGRLIEEARRSGLTIGLTATSALANIQSMVSSAFGRDMSGVISAVASAEHVARKKPAPDLYQLALKMLRRPGAACVAFEDSANGVASAKAAGIFTIATPSQWTRAQDVSNADMVLPSLGDPDRPLGAADAARLGAPFLGIPEVLSLRAKAIPAPGA